jgi:hypothetical protein
MTVESVDAFVEAILADRPPKQFLTAADGIDVLRVAIELRARGPGLGPEPRFVEELHQRLAATRRDGAKVLPFPTAGGRRSGRDRAPLLPASRSRLQGVARPRIAAVGRAVAAILLVASTFAATNLVGHHSPAPVAQPAARAAAVRSGALLTADGRPEGRTYAYSGNPTWVFIDVRGLALNGVYTCVVQLADGTTVTAGLVAVYNGTGDWAHTVKVNVSQLRRATLVTPSGLAVASAIFA